MTKFRLVFSTAMATICLCGGALAQEHTVDLKGIDTSVKPGDDFYKYANGAWIAATEIPADKSSYGPGAILVEKTNDEVKSLIQNAAAASTASEGQRKVGDYYAAFMDEAGIEAKGLAPVKADFDAIAAIHDTASLSAYLGSQLRADVDALNATDMYTDHVLGMWVQQGFEDPAHNVPYLMQGGPSRGLIPSTSTRRTMRGSRPILPPRRRAWTGRPISRRPGFPVNRILSSGSRRR